MPARPQFRTPISVWNRSKAESGKRSPYPHGFPPSTQFQDPGNKFFSLSALSVFGEHYQQNLFMRPILLNRPHRRNVVLCTTSLLTCLIGGSLILSADTPGQLRAATVGTCYCRCAESRAHRSCVKMCEMPKYASRHWAKSCAKPRLHRPIENRDAGPRFEHPGRNERAQLSMPGAKS